MRRSPRSRSLRATNARRNCSSRPLRGPVTFPAHTTIGWSSAIVATCVGGILLWPQPGTGAQGALVSNDRLAGLQWTFVRVRYHSSPEDLARFRRDYWSDPWAIDGPAAEQNLSRRLRTATSIRVGDPVVLALDDPRLWEYPWIYFVEPGNLLLHDHEVEILREFLLRGGTATFDDFSRAGRMGTPRGGTPQGVSGSQDCRLRSGAPDFQLFLRDRRVPADSGARIVLCGGGPGRRAASWGVSGASRTIRVGRWSCSTGTRTWPMGGSGRTPKSIQATLPTRPKLIG